MFTRGRYAYPNQSYKGLTLKSRTQSSFKQYSTNAKCLPMNNLINNIFKYNLLGLTEAVGVRWLYIKVDARTGQKVCGPS